MNEHQPVTACPDCGAKTEKEAETKCHPSGEGDSCPMCDYGDTWEENMRWHNDWKRMQEVREYLDSLGAHQEERSGT